MAGSLGQESLSPCWDARQAAGAGRVQRRARPAQSRGFAGDFEEAPAQMAAREPLSSRITSLGLVATACAVSTLISPSRAIATRVWSNECVPNS